MHEMLDWNDLRVALAVARAGSLSGAAQSLGVHQTTCGRRLGALEQALGFPLFLRNPIGVFPTSEGEEILASLGELADSLTRFEQGVRVGRTGIAGLVRVAATETGARLLVADAVPELAEAHPDLSIELVTGNAPADLAKGEAEMAVRLTTPDEALISRRIGTIRHALYASPEYLAKHTAPLAEGLAGHRVIVPSRELARGPSATWIAQHAREARKVLHSSSLLNCAAAVVAGVGICALPTTVGNANNLTPIRFLTEVPLVPVWLVMHPDVRRVPRVRVVAEVIASCVKKHTAA